MSFNLPGSPFSVRVQVRCSVRGSGFGVRTERELEHEPRSEKLRRVNAAGAVGAGTL
jgi:hypothetical protein